MDNSKPAPLGVPFVGFRVMLISPEMLEGARSVFCLSTGRKS
jgi:hypothetical protein